jgi:hypothetical protein
MDQDGFLHLNNRTYVPKAQDLQWNLSSMDFIEQLPTPSALPPFGTLPLFFALFKFRFTPEWLWSEPSLTPSPLFLFRGPLVPSPPLIPVFAPCGSHLCTPQCCVGLVPCTPVYFWFCCVSCLGDLGFRHAGPSRPNYIVSS